MDDFLILGGSGFIGSHLVRHLRGQGAAVITVARRPPVDPATGDHHAIDASADIGLVEAVLLARRPAHVINLMGGRDSSALEHALVSFRLIRLLARARLGTRLVLAGSAAEYGRPVTLPVAESHPLRPLSEYGFAKAPQSWMARAAFDECGMPVMIARIFNVTGPGQDRAFVLGSAVAQAVEIQMGRRVTASMGNVDAARDFVDVRDVARALELIATRGRPGEAYNVCSGRPTVVRDALRMVAEAGGIPDGFYSIIPEPGLEDVPLVYGTYEKLARETGWAPAIDLRRTIADMVEHERSVRVRDTVQA